VTIDERGVVVSFEQNGVESKRREGIGLGSSQPRFRDDTLEKRALNGRVDVVSKPD